MKKSLQLTLWLLFALFGLLFGIREEIEEKSGDCCQPASTNDPVYRALSTSDNQARLTYWNVSFVSPEQVQVLMNADPNFPICGPSYVLLSSENLLDSEGDVLFDYNGETFNNPATLVGDFDICKRAVMRFKFQFSTDETCESENFNDIFLVLIDSSFGQEEILKRRVVQDCNGPVEDFSLDLQKYKGQTIRITFLVANKGDRFLSTSAKIDCFNFIDPCPNCPCNDLCCGSGSRTRCYSARTHTCINGKLCGIGLELCGNKCYDPNNYGCCTTSSGYPDICQKVQASPPSFTFCPEEESSFNTVPCVSYSNPNFGTGAGFVYYDPRCTSTPSISGCRPDLPSRFCRECRITSTGTSPNECPQCVRDIFAPYL